MITDLCTQIYATKMFMSTKMGVHGQYV